MGGLPPRRGPLRGVRPGGGHRLRGAYGLDGRGRRRVGGGGGSGGDRGAGGRRVPRGRSGWSGRSGVGDRGRGRRARGGGLIGGEASRVVGRGRERRARHRCRRGRAGVRGLPSPRAGRRWSRTPRRSRRRRVSPRPTPCSPAAPHRGRVPSAACAATNRGRARRTPAPRPGVTRAPEWRPAARTGWHPVRPRGRRVCSTPAAPKPWAGAQAGPAAPRAYPMPTAPRAYPKVTARRAYPKVTYCPTTPGTTRSCRRSRPWSRWMPRTRDMRA